LDLNSVQRQYHIFAFQPLFGLDRQAFPSIDIHDGQRTEPSSVRQLIGYKIHRPYLIRSRWMKAFTAMLSQSTPVFPSLVQR
jgi:hypothetical protein